MKLPLKFGIPLLIGLWLLSGYTDYGDGKTMMMILAMGVALWTAFSLPRPTRRKPDYPADDQDGDEELPPEVVDEGTAGGGLGAEVRPLAQRWEKEEPDPDLPANGRGRRPPPDAE